MAALPTLLPLPEAARKYGVDEARLKALIENGKIRAAMIGEEVVVSEDEVRSGVARKEDLPEYRQFANLHGIGIGLREASRKYGIHHATLSVWAKKGVIKVISVEPNRTLLDEQDVAYASFVYRRNGKQGRKIFDKDGLPYKAKTGPFAL